MSFRSSRPSNSLLAVGLVALALANIVSYMVQRHTSLSEHVSDPLVGFAYGVAIMTTLIGIRRQVRQGGPNSRCA